MLFGIVVFTGFGVVEVLLQLFFNDLFRYGNLNHLNELSQHLIACLCALLRDLGLGNLVLHVCFKLINSIELRSKLRELIVNLRKLTLLNSGELHLNGCVLPRVIAAGKRGLESCIFACRQADQGLINTVHHGAGTDLVRQVVCCVNFLTIDFSGDVNGDKIILSCGTLNVLQGTKTLTQSFKSLLFVFCSNLDFVNLNLDTLIVGKLDFRTNGHGDVQLHVCFTVVHRGLALHIKFGLCQRGELILAQCL